MDGPQKQKLHHALMKAFPNDDALELLVSFQLDTSLEQITSAANLQKKVLDLITWAEAQGKLADLVEGAYKENPGNPDLVKFYHETWPVVCQQMTRSSPTKLPPEEAPGGNNGGSRKQHNDPPNQQSVPDPPTTPPPEQPSPQEGPTDQASHEGGQPILKQIALAENALQRVHELVQSNATLATDQCQIATQWIDQASNALLDIDHTTIKEVASQYRLRSNLKYFQEEARKIHVLFFLPSRSLGDIHSKLTSLKKILKDTISLVEEAKEHHDQID